MSQLNPLLEPIGIFTFPATTERFIARERFVVGAGRELDLSEDFQRWFLDKIEEPMRETTLCYAKLLQLSANGPIIAELGEKTELALTAVWVLMNGGADILLINGYPDIFYVPDSSGVLRAVTTRLYDGRLRVSARSIARQYGWDAGCQVFYSQPLVS